MAEKATKKQAETVQKTEAVQQVQQTPQGAAVAAERLDKMSIYIPKTKINANPVGRLIALGERLDRSVNYLVVEAILQYLDREEK